MTAAPSVRALRAAVFAALCVLLAAGGHALATGTAPPVWTQAAGFVPVFVAGFLLGGRERSLAAIGAATLTAQGGLHLGFDAVHPHTGMLMGGAHGMHGMQGMHGMPGTAPVHVTAALHGMAAMPGMSALPGMAALHGMHMAHAHALTPHATIAHVAAAVVLTGWLRRGEAAVWSLLRRAVALVPGLAAWWQVCAGTWRVPAAPDPVRPGVEGVRPLRRLLLRHVVQRRGPPHGMSYAN
ncbi:hypothetical protein LXH13_29895 [Streptomyces spinosirectus]|uniref:hypothetical protein n=1 Tax=Streptomyces TaxID=1883 RepID=UPI001C9E1AD9|nr:MULTISPECIES: hypothetical protein [Streptomyces]MBY8338894.1 hypothetical protein [Streptomyces plumbidurans]UIR20996.1 hypothetical protein LXH13_29895 [Streptomyces spinosirectus]